MAEVAGELASVTHHLHISSSQDSEPGSTDAPSVPESQTADVHVDPPGVLTVQPELDEDLYNELDLEDAQSSPDGASTPIQSSSVEGSGAARGGQGSSPLSPPRRRRREGTANGASGQRRQRLDPEEHDHKMFGIYQALPVPEGEPDWDSGPPETAEEYLRRVRWEAARCPQVVRSEPDPEKLRQLARRRPGANDDAPPPPPVLPDIPDIPDAPAWARPSPDWLTGFLSDFASLRAQLAAAGTGGSGASPAPARLPDLRDVAAWDHLCFGRAAQRSMGPCDGQSVPPAILDAVLGMDQVCIEVLLQRHVEALAPLAALPFPRGAWLFALAARIEKPLHADAGAAFRALLRKCATLRTSASGPADPALPQLNVLIAIAGAYFGQDENLSRLVPWQEMD